MPKNIKKLTKGPRDWLRIKRFFEKVKRKLKPGTYEKIKKVDDIEWFVKIKVSATTITIESDIFYFKVTKNEISGIHNISIKEAIQIMERAIEWCLS